MDYMDTYTDAEEIKRLIPIYEKSNAHNMVAALKKKLDEAKALLPVQENGTPEFTGKDLYELKKSGLSWKEVTAKTGSKAPHLTSARYRKENDLPIV